jgi:hypothetical protein
VLLLLLAAGSALFIMVMAPRLCAVTEPQRHGLACDIPLPPNTTFDRAWAPVGGVEHANSEQRLLYQVAHMTTDAIVVFYRQHLPTTSWHCVQVRDDGISAAQGKRTLGIVLAPPEGASDHVTMGVDVIALAENIDTAHC